jgi:hypothetical protein
VYILIRVFDPPNLFDDRIGFHFLLRGSTLAKVALRDAAKGQIFVQVRPMQTERRDFDVIELDWGAFRESRILAHGESVFFATHHS